MTEVNRKDYRAWYGLGQAYELLSMHQYALYYYQHATALRYVVRTSVGYCSLSYRDHNPNWDLFSAGPTLITCRPSPTSSRFRFVPLMRLTPRQ